MLEWITAFLTNRKERVLLMNFTLVGLMSSSMGQYLAQFYSPCTLTTYQPQYQPVARNFYTGEFFGKNSGAFGKIVDLFLQKCGPYLQNRGYF